MELAILVTVVAVALIFDYTNGFHDAANAIATAISTRALTPRIALTLAAVMNFVGALLGQEVADTVSKVVSLKHFEPEHGLVIVLAALLGAICWNLVTWYFGLPSSSSHALIGALAGAAIAAGATVTWKTIWSKVVIPMVLSPAVGFILAFVVMLALLWILRNRRPQRTYRGFRFAQTISASALALGHGLQDAQKTMGVIFLALIVSGHAQQGQSLPLWVVLAAASAISLGTYSGGWRIMRTLGRRIIKLDPARGFVAEAVGATVLYTTAYAFKAPISTTHVITSAIMGTGATDGLAAVRWTMARQIVTAWVITIPAAGLSAAAAYGILRLIFRLP
ncbi:MAG TPA: inorganic phosphate transporter [Marmoricola sp.]|nr:inorganic phosphate transporter [Marmoricola sp.]